MADFDDMDDFEDRAAALDGTLRDTAGMVAQFDSELGRMRGTLGATGRDVATLEKGLSRGLRSAFDGVVFDGMKLSDALKDVAESLMRTTYKTAMRPVTEHFGGMIAQGLGNVVQGILPFADGAAFSQGRVTPFATGGVISQATAFPMRGGIGVMGEAGPEAIMPLARGSDGKLGVRGGGASAPTVVMNITTPDVQGFQRSQSQIAAQMARALSAGSRNG